VVIHHAQYGFLPGGFLGVDIFFVISGFLITGIILKDLEGDKFTFLGFFERRIRRIMPVLIAMLIVSTMDAIFAAAGW
jgi:peptidoglycan/LPS O-acetylase OafA/YrhL